MEMVTSERAWKKMGNDDDYYLLKRSWFIICQFLEYSIVIQDFYRFYYIKSYYKIMAIIHCAIQYVLIAYIFYT